MKRMKAFFRFDKEERWLEDMAARGWLLKGKFFLYDFRQCEPDRECTIRVDYHEFKNRGEYENYLGMFEDSGWRHIAGSRNSGTQYFMRAGEDSTEDIFSDDRSRAGRYKRIANAWLCMAAVLLPLLPAYGNIWRAGEWKPFEPMSWYFTPGLWELKGWSFWAAFLFETPFALGRGLGGFLPVAVVLMYAIFAAIAWKKYKDAVKERKT